MVHCCLYQWLRQDSDTPPPFFLAGFVFYWAILRLRFIISWVSSNVLNYRSGLGHFPVFVIYYVEMDTHHQLALDQATRWVTDNFSGRHRGERQYPPTQPGPQQRLDIYVIHRTPFRRRIQKYFNGVPCDCSS